MLRRHIYVTGIALATALVVSLAAGASGPADLFNGGDLHEGVGQADVKDLTHGVSYTAKRFPVALRVSPTDGLWGGAQFESGAYRFVQLLHQKSGTVVFHGRGVLTLETSTGRTPTVTQTIDHLRANPALKATAVTPAHIGPYGGKKFDAAIIGDDLKNHKICPGNRKCPSVVSLAPFLANHHCGYCGDATFQPREALDVKVAATGQVFRFIVIDVRGKTVVVYLESATGSDKHYPGSATFPSFVPFANKLLSELEFGS